MRAPDSGAHLIASVLLADEIVEADALTRPATPRSALFSRKLPASPGHNKQNGPATLTIDLQVHTEQHVGVMKGAFQQHCKSWDRARKMQ